MRICQSVYKPNERFSIRNLPKLASPCISQTEKKIPLKFKMSQNGENVANSLKIIKKKMDNFCSIYEAILKCTLITYVN